MRKASVFNILFLFIFSFLMLGFIDRITALFGESDHDRKFVPLYEFYNSLDYDYPEAKRGLINNFLKVCYIHNQSTINVSLWHTPVSCISVKDDSSIFYAIYF